MGSDPDRTTSKINLLCKIGSFEGLKNENVEKVWVFRPFWLSKINLLCKIGSFEGLKKLKMLKKYMFLKLFGGV